jgi:hypothetical protein
VTSETLELIDGRRLTQRRGSWRLDPPGQTVAVEIGSGVVTLTDPDSGQVLEHRLAIADGAQSNGKQPSRSSSSGRSTGDAKRWAAYNSFVDVIAPRLTLAEQAVWQFMFRHARDWVCNTSARRLAEAAGINKATASKSLQTLERAGLVWAIWKSTDKSQASRYGMHPKPADCLHDLIQPKP